MIAFKCLLAVLCLGTAHAQDYEGSGIVEPASTRGRSCYVGIGDSVEAIENEDKECKFLENACQAKVEVSKDGMRVFGECKELTACEGNAANSDCYSLLFTKAESAERDHVCHYCCQGSFCNTGFFVQANLDESRDSLLFK